MSGIGASGNNLRGLDINFTKKMTALPKTITDMPAYVFSRASTKNVIQDGAFVSLSNNQFGTHWDAYGGGYAPTVQPAATNIITYSQDRSNAAWTKTNVTVTSNSIAAPDGSTTADKLAATATAATSVYQAVTATATRMTFSCFIKGGTRTTANLLMRNNTTATNFTSGGLQFASPIGISGAGWEMIPIVNGWYFCRYTNSPTETINIGDTILLYCGATGGSVTAGQYWYVWGAQCESGAWNTAYIPTTSASASRSAGQYGIDYLNTNGSYGALIETAATNLLKYSTMAGGGTPPTGWTVWTGTGGSPVASTLGSDATAYTFGVNDLLQSSTYSYSANTYQYSVYVEAVSGVVYASEIFTASGTLTYPSCDANPRGGANGFLRTGRLVVQGVIAAGSGSTSIIMGFAPVYGTGTSITLSRPQVEVGSVVTSYILTTTASATRAADRLQMLLGTSANYISRSNEFSHANWSKGNCTVAQNVTDPFGVANNAWTLTATATASTSISNSNFNLCPSTTISYSVYVKQGTRANCKMFVSNTTTSTTLVDANFVFSGATVTNITGTTTAENIGSGWYRLKTTISSGVSIGDRINCYAGANGSWTAGETVLVFGAQLESGSSVSTYTGTTTGAIVTTPFNSSFTQSNPYCMYADFRKLVNQGNSNGEFIVQITPSNGIDATNRSSLYTHTFYGAQSFSENVAQMGLQQVSVVNKKTRYAANFENNNFLVSLNGQTLTSDTSGTPNAYPFMLSLQSSTGQNSNLNSAFLYNVKFITKALTQAQLNGLTNI